MYVYEFQFILMPSSGQLALLIEIVKNFVPFAPLYTLNIFYGGAKVTK